MQAASSGTQPEGCTQQLQPPKTLRLGLLHLSGFKSFAEPTTITGFGQLACVQGPNGTGKSALGEALAFVLGASARALRAKSLASLISSCAVKGGALATEATVAAGFEIWGAAGPAPVEFMGIRRKVTAAGRSEISMARTPLADCVYGEARWRPVTLEQLHCALAPFGIHTEALGRTIVTQHRQAVEAADPAKLAAFVEVLIGTASYRDTLQEVAGQLEAKGGEEGRLEEELEAAECQRQALAPEVAKYERFKKVEAEHAARSSQVLGQAALMLRRHAAAAKVKEAEATAALPLARAARDEARLAADLLLARREAAEKEAASAVSEHAALAEVLGDMHVQAARLRVRAQAAKEAARSAQKGAAHRAKCDRQVQKAEREGAAKAQRAASLLRELSRDEGGMTAKVAGMKAVALGQWQGAVDSDPARFSLLAARAAQRSAEAAARTEAAAAAEAKAAAAVAELGAAEIRHEADVGAHWERCKALEEELRDILQSGDGHEREAAVAKSDLQRAQHDLAQHLAAGRGLQEAAGGAAAELRAAADALNSGSSSSRQSVNQAVSQLAKLVPGFHGRLHSVLRVASEPATIAVNRCLMEIRNVSTDSVVATRVGASAVVDHFTRHKVGTTTCFVLDEIRGRDSADVAAAPWSSGGVRPLAACVQGNPNVPGSNELVASLFGSWALVEDAQTAVQVQRAERDAAARGAPRPPLHLVTLCGNIFKADGEMVTASPVPRHLRPFLLTTSYAPVGAAGGGGAPVTQAALAALGQERDAATAALAGYARRAAELEEEVKVCSSRQVEAEGSKRGARAKAAALQKRLNKEEKELDSKAQAGSKLQAQQAAAATELAAVKIVLEGSLSEASCCKVAQEQAAKRYREAVRQLPGGSELLAAEHELDALRQQLAEAQDKAAAAESPVNAARDERQQLAAAETAAADAVEQADAAASQEAAAAAALAELASRLQAATALAAQAQQAGAESRRLWRQALEHHQALSKSAQDAAVRLRDLREVAATLEATAEEAAARSLRAQQWDAELKQEAAQRSGAAPDASARGSSEDESEEDVGGRLRKRLRFPARATHGELAGVPAQKTKGRKKPSATDMELISNSSDGDAVAAAVSLPTSSGGRRKPSKKSRIVEDSDSSPDKSPSSGDLIKCGFVTPSTGFRGSPATNFFTPASQVLPGSGSDSDDDFTRSVSPLLCGRQGGGGVAAATDTARRTRSSGKPHPHPAELPCSVTSTGLSLRGRLCGGAPEEPWEDSEVEAAAVEVERQAQDVRDFHLAVNFEAVSQASELDCRMGPLRRQLELCDAALQELTTQQSKLRADRYARFAAAVSEANAQLAPIYNKLTGGQGDAHCSFPQDEVAAFTEGLQLRVMPDQLGWRPFASLSGGQQSLATLALCFALQAAAPSPFYFFDEIDSALDSIHAQRVAAYLQESSGAGAPSDSAGAGTASWRPSSGQPQYIVVTHRPALPEVSDMRIGVACASSGEGSQAVAFSSTPAADVRAVGERMRRVLHMGP